MKCVKQTAQALDVTVYSHDAHATTWHFWHLQNRHGRIDSFSDISTNAFGEKMKEQVEERLRFYEEGVAPTKNLDAMQAALKSVRDQGDVENAAPLVSAEKPKKKKKKRSAAEAGSDGEALASGALKFLLKSAMQAKLVAQTLVRTPLSHAKWLARGAERGRLESISTCL